MTKTSINKKDFENFMVYFGLAVDNIIDIIELSKEFKNSEEFKEAFIKYIKKNLKTKLPTNQND